MPDRSRYIYLYLPSKADKERWEKLAEKSCAPLSKFIIEIVENALNEDADYKPRGELMKEISGLKKENKDLRDDLRLKGIVIERYEEELKRHRSAAFLENGFEGTRRYQRQLVDLFRHGGTYDSFRILEALGIGPTESELVKAVSKQLEDLESYGMIEVTSTRRNFARVIWPTYHSWEFRD
jgi:predicted DNA-binding protein